MRRTFSDHIEKLAENHDDLIFITGDLGFNAFENLKAKLGNRYINAGVAEQSMVSVAAGMASQGYRVFVYSIAPFLVYRALEQIRNDVCFHRMPVFLVGNGGGYGYGIMGSSHHALSDIGVIAGLPDITAFIPAFKEDVAPAVDRIFTESKPAYLRLGLGKNLKEHSEEFQDFHRINANPISEVTIAFTGPVIWNLLEANGFNDISKYVDIFAVNTIPFKDFSVEFESSLRKTGKLLVFEEHVQQGGLASALLTQALKKGIEIKKFNHRYAVNYPENLYGSQSYHQKQSGLDGATIINDIISFLSK